MIKLDLHINKFNEIITKFLSYEITPDEFCDEFTKAWIVLRDEHLKIKEAIKENWDRPYDQELIFAKYQGKITSEEFNVKYLALWGIEESINFNNMINSIHSLCSSYSKESEYEWQVNEDNLRAQVTNIFQEYKSSTC